MGGKKERSLKHNGKYKLGNANYVMVLRLKEKEGCELAASPLRLLLASVDLISHGPVEVLIGRGAHDHKADCSDSLWD